MKSGGSAQCNLPTSEIEVKKVSKREILTSIHKKEEAKKRANVTFRLSVELHKRFRSVCLANKVSMTDVIEEFMTAFISE